MSSQQPYKVLCVCLGNICRSPTAEAVLRHFCQQQQLNVHVDSAGTAAYHIGEAPDSRSQQYAKQRGYDLSNLRARQLSPQDFQDFDLILAMDEQNLKNIQRIEQQAQVQFSTQSLRAQVAMMTSMRANFKVKQLPIRTMAVQQGLSRCSISVKLPVGHGFVSLSLHKNNKVLFQ